MALCRFAKSIWEMGLLFLDCEMMKAAGPALYYVMLNVCGCLGANPTVHLPHVNTRSGCSGVNKKVEQMFL